MPICTYCGAVLEDNEVDDHNKLTKLDHDSNKSKIKTHQRTTLGVKEK